MSMTFLAVLCLAVSATAQATPEGQKAPDAGADRLVFMRESVASYELKTGGEHSRALELQAKPVFRLGRQYAEDIEDGAIFLWTGEHGRPEAAIQVFLLKRKREPQGLWLHEFTSLASAPITATRNGQLWWTPRVGGLELKPLPGAPEPAEQAAQRTRQMRSLAERFRATDDFGSKGWSELRLLPTPIARYGKAETSLIDGALFAFVLGTDPEVFLFLEVRPGKSGVEWQYALAPMTAFAVKGSYRGDPVWELPNRLPTYDPTKPFFDKEYKP
jgi:hypothetical protein